MFEPSGGPLGDVRTVVLRVGEIDGVLEGPPSQRPALHYPLLVRVESPRAWPAQVEKIGAALAGSAVAWIASEQPGRLEDCPAQYGRASRNIEFARLFPCAGRRVDPGVLQLCRTLESAPELERAELFRDALGGLLHDPKRDEVFPVLDAVRVTGSQAAAAALLGYDESTVYRYLQHVKKVTGRSWQDPLDHFVISAALVCRWLAAQAPEDYAAHHYGPLLNFRALQGRRP